MNITNGIKRLKLCTKLVDDGGDTRKQVDEYLYFWYANNKGRGTNNVTIIRSTEPRATVSSKQTGIIAKTRTSGWSGNVNFSKRVKKELGVENI